MILYSHKKLRGYAKDLLMEHARSEGRVFKHCYHYDVKEPGRQLEAIRMGAKPVDTTKGGMGCAP